MTVNENDQPRHPATVDITGNDFRVRRYAKDRSTRFQTWFNVKPDGTLDTGKLNVSDSYLGSGILSERELAFHQDYLKTHPPDLPYQGTIFPKLP